MVSTTRCLELLHMDLFAPSAVRSYGGNRYTLVIVNDYFRYTWTGFLKDKTEAFDQFEIFSKKIQNQLGFTIVSIRTDHGREFDNEVQFGEFCNANGITHNFSAPRTPQSNCVVERKNRTLQEMSYSQNSKAYIILNKHTKKIEESLNVTFDETPPPSKTSPLVDDDIDEQESIKVTEKKNLEKDIEDETLEIDEIVNIKESRNHPLENVLGNLNQRTLRNNTALAISTTELNTKSAGKACQQSLWIKQALIDYDVTMPRKSSEDYKNTRHYIPIMSHEFRSPIKEKLRNLEERYIHEGRVVFDNFTDLNYVRSLFHFIEFECLLEINEQVCPRFILEFYSQYRLSYSDEGQMFVEFVIQNQLFSYSLENFAQILDVPCEGACVFTDRWRLDELVYGIPSDGPYQTNPPSIEDIISSIRINREGQVRRIRHEEEIDVLDYQILTREIIPTLKPLEEIIRSYVLYDRVMNPLAAQLERKPRRDRGTKRGRHSTSSSSAFDQPSSSHLNDDGDDGNDEGTSRASTPSPIRYVNS
ncbi:retrovirus-related pol polyprotein from transposon TNT 1-94 [Tanacetum coccineum]